MYNIGYILLFNDNFDIHFAILMGINLIGKIKTVPKILKLKWANATVIAAIFPVAIEASIAVTVVPIFAPNV